MALAPDPASAPNTAARVEEPLLLSGMEGLYRNEPKFVSAGFSTTGLTPWAYLRSQPEVILHYLRLAVVPHPLILDYNWPVATNGWRVWPAGLVILALLGATCWAVARGAAGGFLGVWFFAFLAVSSSFVPIADLAFEHRMYLPLAACVAALVLGADRALDRIAERAGWRAGALKLGVAGAAAAVLALLTVSRNDDYRDPVRMYHQLLARVPDHGRMWNNLGALYGNRGQHREASEAFQNSVAHSDPRYPELQKWGWMNLIQSTHA